MFKRDIEKIAERDGISFVQALARHIRLGGIYKKPMRILREQL